MRGSDERTGSLFSYVGIEGRLRPNHPLRAVRALTDETLAAMERELAALYSGIGRPSIAPQAADGDGLIHRGDQVGRKASRAPDQSSLDKRAIRQPAGLGAEVFFSSLLGDVNEAREIGGDFFHRLVGHWIDSLDLERFYEALGLGVVLRIAASAHRSDETMIGEDLSIGGASVLRAAVEMTDAAGRRPS